MNERIRKLREALLDIYLAGQYKSKLDLMERADIALIADDELAAQESHATTPAGRTINYE